MAAANRLNISRRAILGLALAMPLFALTGCGNSAQVNYRVTVEVETPEGLRSGSSVWSFRLSEATVPLASTYDGRFRGEAVTVTLPSGKTLFALLRDASGSDMMGYLPQRQFRDDASPQQREDQVDHIRMIASRKGQTRTLACRKPAEVSPQVMMNPAYDCPMLVTFIDIDDPTSVQLVDPDDLTASFGEGYSLKRITIQITEAPVTTGIKERLVWLEPVGRERGSLVPDPPRLLKNATPRDLVTPGDFSTEIWK